jgi:hypothetical protein
MDEANVETHGFDPHLNNNEVRRNRDPTAADLTLITSLMSTVSINNFPKVGIDDALE